MTWRPRMRSPTRDPVERDDLGPLGDEHGRVGAVEGVERARRDLDAGEQVAVRAGRHHGVVRRDAHALGAQPRGEHDRGGLAQVVGVRLEGEAEQRDVPAAQAADALLELADHAPLLEVVDLDDRVQELEVIPGVAGELFERLDVFGKARAAVADAGLQEVRPDAVVETHAVGHRAHVGADGLADVGDLVDERDLGGQEGVGRVLDHLGGGHAGAHDGGLDAGEERLDLVAVGVAIRADHDAVGVQHVVDGGALAQELGVGDVADRRRPGRLQLGDDMLAGADRHRALHDQQALAVVGDDLAHDALDARQVGVARRRGRRVDGDEQHAGALAELVVGGREREPLASVGHELFEAGLVDRHATVAQGRDLGLVDVEADDLMAEVSDAHRRHQAHVPDSDDPHWPLCLWHGSLLPRSRWRSPSLP